MHHKDIIKNVDALIKLPVAAALLLCTCGCSGTTYFVHEKNQQRYYASNISDYLFREGDESDAGVWQRGGSDKGGGQAALAARMQSDRLRDSNIVGQLYYDADGENRGEAPYSITLRKDYRSYNLETPLTEPIPIGDHKMTPHFSLGRHKDHNMMAGIVLRMPF